MHATLTYPALPCGRFFTKECVRGYRFGFNGQMKDNEVYGEGNSYTAEYWQYDPRLGRRWNLDPKPIINISPYAVFENNPILFSDRKGDCTDCGDDEITVNYSTEGNSIIVVVQSTTIYATFEFVASEALRGQYGKDALKFVEKTLENSIARKELKIKYRALTPPVMRSFLDKVRPLSKEAAPAAGRSAGKTNPKYDKIAGNVGKIGKGLFVVNVAYSVYAIGSSDEPEIETAKQAGIWAGAIAGGYLGGEVGAVAASLTLGPEAAPAGAVAGGVVGGAIGAYVGEETVEKYEEYIKNNLSTRDGLIQIGPRGGTIEGAEELGKIQTVPR